jgi:hypothetical protein
MSNTMPILDTLVTIQSKSIENLVEVSQKFSAIVGKADALDKSSAIIKEWFEKQELVTKEFVDAMKGQVINEKTPDFIREFLKNQEKFGEAWMKTMKDLMFNFSGEKVLDVYKEMTANVFGVWKKSYDQFAGMFSTTFGLQNYDPSAQVKEMHDNFIESARKYVQMLDEQVETAKKTLQNAVASK